MSGPAGPPVTVAVVSWNTRALLERCLDSLAADADAGLAAVWVVDNASHDGSARAAHRPGVARVLALAENVGFAQALELVAKATDTPWIACANADVALAPGALRRLLAAGAARPSAGAIAPRLVLPDGTTQISALGFPTLARHAVHATGLARLSPALGERLALPGHWDQSRARRVDWAVGAFLLLRRDALVAAGGFGTRRGLYAEDLDLGWRLARAGWETWYEPAAVVRHDESAATIRAWGEERHALRAAAGYGWIAARRGYARAVAIATLAVAGGLVRALVGLVWAPRSPSWRRHACDARREARGLVRALRDPEWRHRWSP